MVPRRALLLLSLILSLLIALLLPAPAARAQEDCAGLLEARLAVGGNARVVSAVGLSLKDRPNTGAAGAVEVTLLPFAAVVSVLDGPQCHSGYRWWQVRLADGTSGWSAEANDSTYFLEPAVIGLHVYRINQGGAQIAHYFVTPDGQSNPQGVFNVAPITATAGDGTWQPVETDALRAALDDTVQHCPDRLKGSPWESAAAQADPLNVALPALDYDFVPAPDGSRLLLVRHLRLGVPVCSTVLPLPVGMDRVSLLNADGSETVLFPYPQHGTVPASEDRYAADAPDRPLVYLDEIVWSPQGKYIAFVAAYRDQCDEDACYRFHMYIANLDTGQLYIVGEGRHVGWANGGEQINFFRLIQEPTGPKAHLYTMRPDGTDRQEIWLPGGAIYLSPTQTGLGLPWNEGGTRVLVENAGGAEVMLLKVSDRSFSPPIALPDLMPQPNRLSVQPIKGETALLWTTIRGEFVIQDIKSGEWQTLHSQVASTGIPVTQVRAFAGGSQALVELADGSALILDTAADTLAPVAFSG